MSPPTPPRRWLALSAAIAFAAGASLVAAADPRAGRIRSIRQASRRATTAACAASRTARHTVRVIETAQVPRTDDMIALAAYLATQSP